MSRTSSCWEKTRFTKTTLDTYAHLWPDEENQTRELVDDEFSEAVEDPLTESG